MGGGSGESSNSRTRSKLEEVFIAKGTAVEERNAGVGSKCCFAAVNQPSSTTKCCSLASHGRSEGEVTCRHKIPGPRSIRGVPNGVGDRDCVGALESHSWSGPVEIWNKQIVCAAIECAADQANGAGTAKAAA